MKLLDSLFSIVSASSEDGRHVYTIRLNPEHFIYKAHFPGEPITPGVCIMQIAIELRSRYPEMPFFCDPSHMGGARQYIQEISQRSLDLGLDGLMIESHCDPTCALSDAQQQLTPRELGEMLGKLVVRKPDSDSPEYKVIIHQL